MGIEAKSNIVFRLSFFEKRTTSNEQRDQSLLLRYINTYCTSMAIEAIAATT
jgi:hypothetical protein